MNGFKEETVKFLLVVVVENMSPNRVSAYMIYCLMIPLDSSGSGGLHDNCTAVELNRDTVKLVGGPSGTIT